MTAGLLLDRPPDSRIGSYAGKVPLRHRLGPILFGAPPVLLHGADISHYQTDAGELDWDLLRAAGPWFACKATEGTTGVDPSFHLNRAQARKLRFTHRIFYHWLRPDSSPTLQAEHFLDVVQHLEAGEGVMLDVEQPGVTVGMVVEWCNVVGPQIGRPIVIYTGAFVAGGSIWQSKAVRLSPYGPRPMHVAAYTTEARMRTLQGMAEYPPDGWQYSSNGPVPGVVKARTVRCDMNHIFNWAPYNAACAITNLPTPTPTPAPVPLPPMSGDDMTVQPVPFRAYDSRSGDPFRDGETFHVDIPAIPPGARGVLVNVTVTGSAAPGVIVAWGDSDRPPTSNLNYAAGETVANAALVPLTVAGGINLFASTSTHVIVDVQGWSS